VGAGLPIIDTLQNMFKSGDRLVAFSGIMSGSLSYIFGRLDEGTLFSEAVLEAREKGFTEPDPRDDLSGMDVARKALSIAREAGYPLELQDVAISQVFPAEFDSSGTTEEFLKKLPQLDGYFSRLMERLRSEGKALRMAAEINSAAEISVADVSVETGKVAAGKCRVGCIEVGQDHPLWAVKGGENAFVINTKRYNPLPLVVRGYGAGAGVTAAGVFADILRTVSWNHLSEKE
jgi:aspartokinase/homoserine dehydrogenase 1